MGLFLESETEQVGFGFAGPAQHGLEFPKPLAEKYRPVRVCEFIALDKVRKILGAFIQRPSSCAWVFNGPSGVGKSTMALAMARELGAEVHHIPSQKCNAENIEAAIRMCWYATRTPGGFHLVLIDEADRMTAAAQLQLLSKLDSTDPPPQTIFVFTCNNTEGLEKRFLSRCRVLEFSSYGMRDDLATFLAKVWVAETGSDAGAPDFARLAKDSTNNVRDALMRLELELLAR